MKLFRTNEIDTDTFQVGDVISFNLTDGEEVEAMAVKQEQDGMLFCLVDCLADEYAMNEENTNRGGYDASDLRAVLNEKILERFPEELREKMVAFENGDLLRLPTEREIFGENYYGDDEPSTVTQWEPMKDTRNRIVFQGSKTGTWEWYWLSNRRCGSAAGFANVGIYGSAYYGSASFSHGVRPAFKI